MSRYDELVDDRHGLIGREIFVDPAIYREELERVFARAWLFIGHESQIPEPGDFFVSRMGEESVILCRDRERKIHVFLNTCRHRGMRVCRYDEGNTPLFTCPYHAWSYATDGTLVGVPQYAELYEGVLDRAQWSLIEVAQLATYKGTIWATWDPAAPPFLEYLGDARILFDSALDCRDGREGGSSVLGGITKWIVPSSWKFGAENFVGDGAHVVSHRSVELVGIGPSARAGVKHRKDTGVLAARRMFASYPQGHGGMFFLRRADDPYEATFAGDESIEAYFRACHAARRERLGTRSVVAGHLGTIFPNTSFHANQPRSIFVWHPHSPTEMEVWRFHLVDADAPDNVKDALRRYYMRYAGPAGMTEQDDMENWHYATAASRGTIAQRFPYNYQQSYDAGVVAQPLAPSFGCMQNNELSSRRFYRRWRDYMNGAGWDELLGRHEDAPVQTAID
jgi:phenylpropionate dioxygenase-like ring-hydroxylating dioxygenase large terminal subunit